MMELKSKLMPKIKKILMYNPNNCHKHNNKKKYKILINQS